jgi:peptidoglycan-N-acetylglucosamine deacetylase
VRSLHRFLAAAAAALVCVANAAPVAVTLDDGPQLAPMPRLDAPARDAAMRAALARHGVTAALFVTAGNGAQTPAGLALARAWGEAGHRLGNHTVTHLDLNHAEVTLAQYQAELLACDAVIAPLPGYRRWFRYTYLREGNTPDKRDGMRGFLQSQGYRNAAVTLDTSDWRLDGLLRKTLQRDPTADLEPIRQAYLAHVWQRAQAYDALARRLQGREVPQVLLLHHNLINALWLDDVLAMFQARGWRFVTPDEAYADPLYALQPERAVPGQSLLLSMARTLGLGRFEGWERLVDDGDHEVAALAAAGYPE